MIYDVFKFNLIVIYKASWLEITKTFTSKNLEKECVRFMRDKSMLMTAYIIRDFKAASPLLYRYGSTYRLYALASVTVNQLGICGSPLNVKIQTEAVRNFRDIFQILEKYAGYYPLARNMHQSVS
ncbi:hypothetical protein DSO57_1015880 [Entomophthora muscae]|uniref:Uncharacterized protein n=1 Tax=Entomophthora muscae TaxID=34485 RepID=A0ACC2RJM6_9FUNG|nr:hypothetical protein DSO57_1015880 [Entomophthora muscae]